MSKIEEYSVRLTELKNWDDYLLAGSGLPGPRGNIELAQAVADVGDHQTFDRYIAYTAE